MSRTPLLLSLSVVAAAAALALTGCSAGSLPGSSSGGSSSGGSSSGTSGNSSSSKAPSASGGASGSIPAHCPSSAKVGSAVGASVPAVDEKASAKLLTCTYADSSSAALVILYEPIPAGTSLDQIKADVQAKTGGSLGAVSGIGDGGFSLSDGDDNYLYVVKGRVQFAIGGGYPLDTLKSAAPNLLAG